MDTRADEGRLEKLIEIGAKLTLLIGGMYIGYRVSQTWINDIYTHPYKEEEALFI